MRFRLPPLQNYSVLHVCWWQNTAFPFTKGSKLYYREYKAADNSRSLTLITGIAPN